MRISGTILNVVEKRMTPGEILVENGVIRSITPLSSAPDRILLPGFVDAHVHIESSMLPPSEFARLAVVHGTVATVSDPHEIGNVLGSAGVHWMIENANTVPLKFFFGAPSCVPATNFETAGATIPAAEVAALLALPEIRYLSEMMNFPGVLFEDPEVMAKIAAAKKHGKVVDGHAPGLRGKDAALYASRGITTDHECFTAEEARDKIDAGMSIIIREGSAAKNFEALIDLIDEFPDQMMFCSDDKHPNDLLVGHIDQLVRRALRRGKDRWSVLRAATLNPVKHYGLSVGLLREGDPADFIVADDLEDLTILETYIDGGRVSADGESFIERITVNAVNHFHCSPVKESDLQVPAAGDSIRVISALPGQLITKETILPAPTEGGFIVADPSNDILKLVVINRYSPAKAAVAFVKGFGLQDGALASSVAHDSHNIVAVGANDTCLVRAINLVIAEQGGISLATAHLSDVVPLPIAGLMSVENGREVADRYEAIDRASKTLGSTLPAPFMTLSFLALLVIPELKLSDLGLFDGRKFEFTPLFA